MENRSLQNMRKQDLLDLINNQVNGIQAKHKEATELTDEIEQKHSKADDCLLKIQDQKQKADDFLSEINNQTDNINTLKSEMDEWHSNSSTCISDIKEKQETANELTNKIQEQSDTANNCISDIKEKQETANELTDKIQEQSDTASKTIKEKEQTLEQLTKKIEGLLPGATSTGLASSYHEARKGSWCIIFYWIGFIGSLIGLVGGGYFVFLKNISQDFSWNYIIVRIVVGAPLVWIAWYCQKSLSDTNRIKEEYHHKQRIMAIFDGFSKEIDRLTENDSEENKKKLELISVIIEAIRKNPAETIKPSNFLLDSLKIEETERKK